MSQQGTPQTLLQAIQNGLTVGDHNQVHDNIYTHVRDFLSQKFAVALLRAENQSTDPRTAQMIQELWNKITGENQERKS